MLRIAVVLVVIGAFEYQTCHADSTQDDWRRQGFYRPRRNYPTQNEDTFQTRPSQNYQSQGTFGSAFGPVRSGYSQPNSFGASQTKDSRISFGQNTQNAFGRSNQNPQNQAFGSNQNTFRAGYSQISGSQDLRSQNSFGGFSRNPIGQSNGQSSFEPSFSLSINQPFDSYSQKTNQNNYYNPSPARNLGQNAFGNIQNQNPSYSASNAFAKGQAYQAPGYLPPKRFMAPEYLPPDEPKTTTRRTYYSYTTTTTRRPYNTTTTTERPETRKPPGPSPAMATPVPPEDDDYDNRPDTMKPPPAVAPALATPVPPEPEDGGEEIFPEFRTTTGKNVPAPAMATPVPPEPEDGGEELFPEFPTTTGKPAPAPALATPVPPEEDDPTTTPSTTTTSTSPPTTTSTVPPTTTTTTPPPTTTSTPPPTTTSTEPPTTTTTTPPPTTTSTEPPTTTTTTPPPTTTSTEPPTTTTTPPPTTTSTEPPTTTRTETPTTTSTEPTTTSTAQETTTIPLTTTNTTPSTTSNTSTPDPNRNLIEEGSIPNTPLTCDPLDPSTYPLQIDERNFGDSPCAPITTTTTTTVPPTTTTPTKPPYRGPFYLPPPPETDLCEPKTRVKRSLEPTLRLGDLEGTPRPVWYAGIYKKVTDPYYPICGGSIVREDIIISAAHCFWDDDGGKQPAKLFAVAARKIYKPWKEAKDKNAQKSDVLEITIPPRYLGTKASFQDDIAILKLATPFTYSRGVRPICVDFDVDFDREQMKEGHYGTVAGWGYTDSKGTATQRLLWLELPYIEIEKCIRDSEESFLKYITSDKVCAGENDTGRALCRGDSGGGLAFWRGPASHATPYLRGIASTAPTDKNAACNVFAYASFTHIFAHRTFLRDHLPGIEQCRFWE